VTSSSLPGEGDETELGDENPAPSTIGYVHLVDLKLGVAVVVTKEDVLVTSDNPALPGDALEIRITLLNQGASPLGCPTGITETACALRLVSMNIPLPAGTLAAYNAALRNVVVPAGSNVNMTPITWTVPTDAAQTQIIVVAEAGTYSDTLAQVAAYLAHGQGQSPLVLGTPKLALAIQAAPNPPVFGQNITYVVTATNTGMVPVTITGGTYQIIPTAARSVDGIMLVSAQAQTQPTYGTLTFTPTVLLPNQTAQAMVAKLEDQRATYTFRATVNGVGLTLPVVVSTDLLLTPSGAGALDPNATEPEVTKAPSAANVQPGGAVNWTITVRNGSTAVMPGVVVNDTVPPTMTVTSAASSRGEAAVSGAQVSVTIGDLNPGETVTVTLNTTLAPVVIAPATVTNTACASRQGGAQVCEVGTVTVGPGVGTLPATGLRAPRPVTGWRWDRLLGVAISGALMLALSMPIARRRKMAALIFLLVALVAIGGAVVLVLRGGDETPDDAAQAPPAAPPDQASAPAAEESAAPAAAASIPTPYKLPEPAGARTLMIPKLSGTFRAPIPILELPIINRQWDVGGLGAYIGWLDGTTWLEPDWGNTVLAAHVQLDAQTPGPFWGLGELVPGDEIIVREGETERVFVVTSTRTVAPDDVSVTAPTVDPTLTLVTCTNWDDAYGVFAQRLVVQAVPVT